MAQYYKRPINFRAPAYGTETADINSSTLVALLSEAPADPANPATPMAVTVGGQARTRVTTPPTAGQYRVSTQIVIGADGQPHTEYLPILDFNVADAGQTATVMYYRTGTVLTSQFFDLLVWFLTPLTGIADLSTLQSTYPATLDAAQRGRPGDQCYLTSGVAYFSDGLQWRQFSATQPNNWSDSVSMLMRHGISPASSFSAAWTAARALAAAHGFTTSSAYSTGTVDFLTVAAALGITSSSSFTASWLKGQSVAMSHAFAASNTWVPGGGPVISYVGSGTEVNQAYGNGATVTLPVPAGLQQDDLLIIEASIDAYDVSAWPGTGINGIYPVAANWLRAGASQGNLTFTASGFDGEAETGIQVIARVHAFRGVIASGSPMAATSGTAGNASTNLTGSALTTNTANAMIVMLGVGTASAPGGSVDTVVNGASLFMAYDNAPSNSAGAQPAPTATGSGVTPVITIALKPA